MPQKARVIKNPRKGDYWDVIVVNEAGTETTIEQELPYAPAYQAKLAAEKRIADGLLVVRRKPLIII